MPDVLKWALDHKSYWLEPIDQHLEPSKRASSEVRPNLRRFNPGGGGALAPRRRIVGVSRTMWQDLSNDPEQLPRFADTLRLFSRRLGWEFGAFCAWVAVEAELVAGTMVIVDVGRSHRPVSCAVARQLLDLGLVVRLSEDAVLEGWEEIECA